MLEPSTSRSMSAQVAMTSVSADALIEMVSGFSFMLEFGLEAPESVALHRWGNCMFSSRRLIYHSASSPVTASNSGIAEAVRPPERLPPRGGRGGFLCYPLSNLLNLLNL